MFVTKSAKGRINELAQHIIQITPPEGREWLLDNSIILDYQYHYIFSDARKDLLEAHGAGAAIKRHLAGMKPEYREILKDAPSNVMIRLVDERITEILNAQENTHSH